MFILSLNGVQFETEHDLLIGAAKLQHFGHSNVRLIHKGKLLDDTKRLSDYFVHQKPYKIMVLVTTVEQESKQAELVDKHERALQNYHRALATRPKHEEIIMGFCKFVEPLSGFSDIEKSRELLQRIRDDIGIRLIMKQREWRVTTLKELHPDEKTILGYNQNKGQVIALRLRTDELDGFRHYPSIIKVMLHELAHMIFSEHDEHFHRLDRELNIEYGKYTKKNTLERNQYSQPIGTNGIIGGSHKLGGKEIKGSQREVLLKAVELRLTKEEEELQSGCLLNK